MKSLLEFSWQLNKIVQTVYVTFGFGSQIWISVLRPILVRDASSCGMF